MTKAHILVRFFVIRHVSYVQSDITYAVQNRRLGLEMLHRLRHLVAGFARGPSILGVARTILAHIMRPCNAEPYSTDFTGTTDLGLVTRIATKASCPPRAFLQAPLGE